jgi:hypothetical protein
LITNGILRRDDVAGYGVFPHISYQQQRADSTQRAALSFFRQIRRLLHDAEVSVRAFLTAGFSPISGFRGLMFADHPDLLIDLPEKRLNPRTMLPDQELLPSPNEPLQRHGHLPPPPITTATPALIGKSVTKAAAWLDQFS